MIFLGARLCWASMVEGTLKKMKVLHAVGEVVHYQLPLDDELISLNELLGQRLQLHFLKQINCVHCGRKTSKSFQQGYCFPCFRSLAQCDTCILKPELCHFDKGTCREPEWAMTHCMIPHTVYLANSSGLKVGITRSHQRMTRWIDQGAVAAIPLVEVKRRKDAGLVEIALGKHMSDKTNWRKMLKGDIESIDLEAAKSQALKQLPNDVAWQVIEAETYTIDYPVLEYPKKIASHNFDKQETVEGRLMGIKGQYLIFDTGVINIRKFSGYRIRLEH